jgi:hypothetical protein
MEMGTRQSRAPASAAETLSASQFARDVAASWDRAAESVLAWYESWLKIASMPFDVALRRERSRPSGSDRRAAALPWVPQFDAKVVPLRRASDPPGTEASRVTMCVAMPTVFGLGAFTNMLRVDTLLPLPSPAALESFGEQVRGALDLPWPVTTAATDELARVAPGESGQARPSTH